jgi:hypothetical protein
MTGFRQRDFGCRRGDALRVEETFGWGKVVGLIRKARVRGLARVGGMFIFAMAAYNLVRMRNLQKVAGYLLNYGIAASQGIAVMISKLTERHMATFLRVSIMR